MRGLTKTYGYAIVSGALLALSFPGWRLFPLAWIALIPLFAGSRDTSPADGFKLFFLAGWVFYSMLLYWLMTNVYWAGGWAFWGYQALAVIMALYWGVLGTAWTWVRYRAPRWGGAATVAVFWVVMEFLQSRLFSGFGWGTLAYSQGRNLYALQWAALGGAHIVSAFIVGSNALLADVIMEPEHHAKRFTAWLILVAGCHVTGLILMNDADYLSRPFRSGIVQADFPLEMKWDPEYEVEMVRNTAEKSRLLAETEEVDLFVWPESLVMAPIDKPAIMSELTDLTMETNVPLLTGAVREGAKGQEFNTAYLISSDGTVADYYDKVHLAPFGEYVPLGSLLPFVQKVVPAIGDIEAGTQLKVFSVTGRKLGPLICFEVLFSNLAERLRNKGADVLVVMTNLGWFGSSNAIPQELDIARVRAIETRLPLVHSANTGISGVFDPWGRFQCVNAGFDSMGRRVTFKVSPYDTMMNRLAGVFSVAAPGRRPIPYLPWVFPWIMLILAIGAIALVILVPGPTNERRATLRLGHRLE